jgi:hypothetical protein
VVAIQVAGFEAGALLWPAAADAIGKPVARVAAELAQSAGPVSEVQSTKSALM